MESANPAVWDAAEYTMIAYCVVGAKPRHNVMNCECQFRAGETTLEEQFRTWARGIINCRKFYRFCNENDSAPVVEDDAEELLEDFVYLEKSMDNKPFVMHGLFRHCATGRLVTANLVEMPEFRFRAIVTHVLNELLDTGRAKHAKHA